MNTCPRCGAGLYHRQPSDTRFKMFECCTTTLDGEVDSEDDQCKLRQIAALCRAGEVTAEKVLAIIEGGTT